MPTLHEEIIDAIGQMEADLGSPTFTWQGNSYNCIPSVSTLRRDLETGGFQVYKLLTMTVARYDASGNAIFPNDALPQPQQTLTFENLQYRIETVKHDSIYDVDNFGNRTSNGGARMRIIAVSTTRGI